MLLGMAIAIRMTLPAPVHWLNWAFDAPALFCGLCITAKRLHDRGRRRDERREHCHHRLGPERQWDNN